MNKSTIVVFSFVVLSLSVFYKAWRLDLEDTEGPSISTPQRRDGSSEFVQVEFFQKDKIQNRPLHHLIAQNLWMPPSGEKGIIDFVLPRGKAYAQDGREVYYEGDFGKLFQNEEKIYLEGQVLLKDLESEIRSQKATYEIKNDFFHAQGNVRSRNFSVKTKDKIFVNSDEALSWPKQRIGHYIGNVDGEIQRHRPFEPGIDFKADRIEADLNKSYIELIDDVYLKKGELQANAIRGEIFLENYNKKLRYYALYDDVKIVERVPVASSNPQAPPSFVERRAYSEKLEGFVKEEKIVLTGYPKVIQDRDVIKGNIITLLERNEVIEVDDSDSSFILKE